VNINRRVKKDLGALTLENVEKYIRRQNWILIYYGDKETEDYLKTLHLESYAEQHDAFSVRDRQAIIFVRESVPEKQKINLLLHEIAHIVLEHDMSHLKPADETAADQFVVYCLKPTFKVWKIAVAFGIVATIILVICGIKISRQAAYESSIVYITASGTKYHIADCTYIKNKDNIVAISRADAITLGKEPCRVCRPDASFN